MSEELKPLSEVVEQITTRLFTNGFGEKAVRLVLELPDGRDGGGWCKAAVRDQIFDAIAAWNRREEGRKG